MASELEHVAASLDAVYQKRIGLRDFDVNAADILVICGALHCVLHHLIEMERDHAKTRKTRR